MHRSVARRTLLKTFAFGLASVGVTAGQATQDEALIAPDAGQLKDLVSKLAATPRRRDFKTVPMILTSPAEWDNEALKLVLGSKAERKQVWNNTEIGGYWLTVMRNALNTQIWGFRHPDFLVVSATHGSAGFALYDQATWDKYQIGKLLGELLGPKIGDKLSTNALIVEKPGGDQQDFENPQGLFAMGEGDRIPLLQKRGVVFMACHNAIWGHAELLIKHDQNPDKLDRGALAAELTNHLIAGTVLTPGIVGTLPELQRAGFFYASI